MPSLPSSSPQQYRVPNLLSMIPFPWPGVHADTERATSESIDWVDSHNPFDCLEGAAKGATRKFFEQTGAGLLGGYAYPHARTYAQLRAVTDFINTIYVLDEITDTQSGIQAKKTVENHLSVLFGEKESDGEAISEISRQLRVRLLDTFGEPMLARTFRNYADTAREMVREAENRSRGQILGFNDYKDFRLKQGATRPVFDLIECCGGYMLPDTIHADQMFIRMYEEAMLIVCWTNDICSYNNEQSTPGHAYANVVTVLMRENNLSLQQAMDRIGTETEAHFRRYCAYKLRLPSTFGSASLDAEVQDYIYGMDCWVAGEIHYAFNIPKYFGKHLERARKEGLVDLI